MFVDKNCLVLGFFCLVDKCNVCYVLLINIFICILCLLIMILWVVRFWLVSIFSVLFDECCEVLLIFLGLILSWVLRVNWFCLFIILD